MNEPEITHIHVKMDKKLREDLKQSLKNRRLQEGRNLSVTDFVVEAAQKHVQEWGQSAGT